MSAENSSPGGPPAIGSRHRFENIEFDDQKGELRVAGRGVAMEPRPLRVLAELLLRVNEVVTKEELYENVWEGRTTVEHVLANAISKLRAAMGEAGGARIVTVPRVDYRLSGPVQRLNTLARRTTFTPGHGVPGREGFVLEQALGEASRSEVWLARHRTPGHQHVFKLASDGRSLSGLKREFTLGLVLNKELGPRNDLVAIKEAQLYQATYFIERDYVGPNLLQWAEQHGLLVGLSLDERLAFFLQAAQMVAAAHSVGVLHKDLRPSNVLVSGLAGQLQLRPTDFGSGQLLNSELLQQLKLTQMGLTAVPLGRATRQAPFRRWHANTTLGLETQRFTHTLLAESISGESLSLPGGSTASGPASCAAAGLPENLCRTAGWTRWDYALQWQPAPARKLGIHVYNLTGKREPINVARWRAAGGIFPPTLEDARGRTIQLSLRWQQ